MLNNWIEGIAEKYSADKILFDIVSWVWSWVHPTAYWVCCCGLVICILMYIVSKSRKCVYDATKFGFVLFAVEAVDAACRGV